MISVLVADDHGVVREGLRRVIESESDVQVCAEAGDGRQVIESIEAEHPDVVILDITMPRMGGLESLDWIREHHPDIHVILLSVSSDAQVVSDAIFLGADGYVLKNGRADEIVQAIRAVSSGGSYFSPLVAREVAEQVRDQRKGPFEALSRKEITVLRLVAEGLSAKEIGSKLELSAKTIEGHRSAIMRKLGFRKATELVRYAIRHGLIDP